MATVESLKKALIETLESKGVINNLKAQIRTEVFHALDDPSTSKPTLNSENLLINELIREYLIFNNYKYTDSVLVAETGQPKNQLDRSFLSKELNVEDTHDSLQLPLLYSLLHSFIQDRKDHPMSAQAGLCIKNPPGNKIDGFKSLTKSSFCSKNK